MTRRTLTDEEIGEALLRGAPEREDCIDEDRIWDLARGVLDPEVTGRILDHSLLCPDCSLALRVARETFAVSHAAPPAPRSTSALARLWGRLAGSVLGPLPALAYLVLLLLSFPLYRVVTTRAPAPGLRSLQIVRLTGEPSLRGGGEPAAPLRVHLAGAEALVLKLFPDVEELPKDPSTALLVRVLDGETVVAATTRRVTDLEKDQSLSLLLEPALLHPGTTYSVELTTPRPGAAPEPSILRQSFRVERD